MLERARRAGVVAFIVVGVDLPSSRMALELAERHPDVHAAVGMHPHDASEFTGSTFYSLRRCADSRSVVAIGEIGLDYYRNFSPPPTQRRVFLRMLELAAELKLPVIVHSRGSDVEMRRVLGDWALSVQVGWPKERPLGVMHSFHTSHMHPPESRPRACRGIWNSPVSDGGGDGLPVSGTPIISWTAQRAILLAGDGAPDSTVAGS